ncbi:hypothetical protein [Gordonia sp. (in: high G+C Gram-positive bacteria)]|jgi:Mce-associated membrane protein|uniref:hypothetical protein n=1 Tax=Gordonia sp. (in: high G+C Gram-positive bacteria) TaxID=84139 RepID=UPI00260A8E76|nr:hypothetical protein [Gordonia sp. (in: high G+C Gram-positive bacteria)]HMS77490.1 hypothetical protein [Gordonia sp. (in: high G+C Gram-positive bacteria)]
MSDDSSHSADESVSDAETPVDDQQTVSLEKAGGDTADEPKAPDSDDSDSDDSGSQDDAADSAPVGTVPSEAQVRSKRTRMLVTAAAGVAALVALVFAVIFGMSGYKVYTDEKPTQSAREDATVSAENAIINITTIDPANVKDWQRRIDSSLTGDARTQITPDDFKKLTQQIQAAGTGQVAKLSSRVLRSAPVEVNADDGTARVLVYVEATSKKSNEAGVKRSMGFMVGMTKNGDLWKASSITSLDSLALESDMANAGDQGTATQTQPTQTQQPSTTEGAGN